MMSWPVNAAAFAAALPRANACDAGHRSLRLPAAALGNEIRFAEATVNVINDFFERSGRGV